MHERVLYVLKSVKIQSNSEFLPEDVRFFRSVHHVAQPRLPVDFTRTYVYARTGEFDEKKPHVRDESRVA